METKKLKGLKLKLISEFTDVLDYNYLRYDVEFYLHENMNILKGDYVHKYYFNKDDINNIVEYYFTYHNITLTYIRNIIDRSNKFAYDNRDILPNFTSNLPFKIIQELADEIVKFVINI